PGSTPRLWSLTDQLAGGRKIVILIRARRNWVSKVSQADAAMLIAPRLMAIGSAMVTIQG
ncbi:MAG: hypothetical protein M3082_01055, partial [Candidatus Dormibacteraeota bacterium]|nr:hypothetical protein [Candidatus Dormibacteraeota bacterium]